MAPKAPEMGNKKRAGNLLSHYLRLIAQETMVITDVEKGEDKVVTKAEAAARLIWNKSLGHKEERLDDSGNKVMVEYEPDTNMLKLLYDRLEGKVANPEENRDREQKLPDKISDTNRDRLNKMAEKSGKE